MTATLKAVTLAVPVSAIDHVAGPEDAPVTGLEYGDFERPLCQAVEPPVSRLRELHPVDLGFAFRHFPLEDVHPRALLAAEAGKAAVAPGQFWPMHDLLLTQSRRLTRRDLEQCAAQLGLDLICVKAELDDEIYRPRIREQVEGGRWIHLRATPGFFVNGIVQDVSGGMHEQFELVAAEVHRASRRSRRGDFAANRQDLLFLHCPRRRPRRIALMNS